MIFSRPVFFTVLVFLGHLPGHSQSDTLKVEEITVNAREHTRPVSQLPASVSPVDSSLIQQSAVQSIIPSLNNVAGVRMEERSPGSYRLSIRGSLLRSPFGVRNLKVYLDEMPLTNAGGETYLNLIDQAAIHTVDVHKGPDGSLFGANSGGVLRLNMTPEKKNGFVQAKATAGSFALYRFDFKTQQQAGSNSLFLNAALQRGQGYRDHSAMQRFFVNGVDKITYKEGGYLKVMLLGSFLNYETPGGLTVEQRDNRPASARPPTANTPGAEEQGAAVFNNTLLGSVTNAVSIGAHWSHLICLFGSVTDFKNPFISNYEEREEGNFGFRTYLKYEDSARVKKIFVLGTEQQAMSAEISNYGNDRGEKTLLMARDKTSLRQGFVFSKAGLGFGNRWLVDLGLSVNFNGLKNTDVLLKQDTAYTLLPQLMPRLALSYSPAGFMTLRAIVSRGYSAPTLQELRPSSLTHTGSLEPEHGWNYELGLRTRSGDGRLSCDLTGFLYQLQNAIVRRTDSAGSEYFVNSGGTFQPGGEAEVLWTVVRNERSWIRTLNIRGSFTYYQFRFRDYATGGADHSGNALTGVPAGNLAVALDSRARNGLFLFGQLSSVSDLPLDDLNSTWTEPVSLLLIKAGYGRTFGRVFLELAAGVDNLLNRAYSAGPDLNAFGGRFYNPSPGRNYFTQILVRF